MSEWTKEAQSKETNRVSTSACDKHKAFGNANKHFTLSLLNQNFQCIKNKIYELDVMLNDELRDLDIICGTEHWLNEKEINSYPLPNYKISSSFCRSNYKNGGSIIFVKDSIPGKHTEKKLTYYLNEEKVFEHSVTEFKHPNISLTIACVYRSPDGCLISFLEKLEILLNSLTNKNSQLILCGDFNINFLDSDSSIVSEFRSVIHSFNLGELITSPT